MTDLEIASAIRQHVQTSTMRCMSQEQDEILAYCRAREKELEAREAKDPVDGLPPALAERVARLEKAMRRHQHYPCFKGASMLSSTARI